MEKVSIVGALVVSQAAVEAEIVSAPLVIVVATTGIASFMFPGYSLKGAIRLLCFFMIFLEATLAFMASCWEFSLYWFISFNFDLLVCIY